MVDYTGRQRQAVSCRAGSWRCGPLCASPGDPKRCAKIAKYFDNLVWWLTAASSLLHWHSSTAYPSSVTSTGIGGPSASIALEELTNCGLTLSSA